VRKRAVPRRRQRRRDARAEVEASKRLDEIIALARGWLHPESLASTLARSDVHPGMSPLKALGSFVSEMQRAPRGSRRAHALTALKTRAIVNYLDMLSEKIRASLDPPRVARSARRRLTRRFHPGSEGTLSLEGDALQWVTQAREAVRRRDQDAPFAIMQVLDRVRDLERAALLPQAMQAQKFAEARSRGPKPNLKAGRTAVCEAARRLIASGRASTRAMAARIIRQWLSEYVTAHKAGTPEILTDEHRAVAPFLRNRNDWIPHERVVAAALKAGGQ
jgi:hypothetical protein